MAGGLGDSLLLTGERAAGKALLHCCCWEATMCLTAKSTEGLPTCLPGMVFFGLNLASTSHDAVEKPGVPLGETPTCCASRLDTSLPHLLHATSLLNILSFPHQASLSSLRLIGRSRRAAPPPQHLRLCHLLIFHRARGALALPLHSLCLTPLPPQPPHLTPFLPPYAHLYLTTLPHNSGIGLLLLACDCVLCVHACLSLSFSKIYGPSP